jgi:hypothetical protein
VTRAAGQASSRVVLVAIALWFVAALAASASGRVATLQPPAPQIVLGALTIAALVAMRFAPPVSAWALAVDIRVPVALHLTRVIGLWFIYLGSQGQLPETFAFPAGIGDAVVATIAAVLLVIGPPSTPRLRTAYLIWNGLGLADILFVVASAARHALADPASMHALLVLPLSLLPTFLVPLIIVSHVLVFNRLRR